MNSFYNEKGYLEMLSYVLSNGEKRLSRNGNIISCFCMLITFTDVFKHFPLLTSKKMFIKGIIEELLWFLKGSTNAKELQDKGVHIWDGNSSREYLDSVGLTHYPKNELGPIYGFQWRKYGKKYSINNDNTVIDDNSIDQIEYVIQELMKTDYSRRAVLTGWNPLQLKEMALPPCHMVYTFYRDSNGLSCLMNMRSSDLFLGLPFNIASTAVLTNIIAKVLHLQVNKIAIVITDAHIYEEHIKSVEQQLNNNIHESPVLNIKRDPPEYSANIKEKIKWIDNLTYEDFEILNYKSEGIIKAIMK